MKDIPLPLLQMMLSNEVQSTYLADLITVTLTSGQVFYITDGQLAIKYDGKTFEPVKWGSWRCTGTKVAIGLMNASADITVAANSDVLSPNFNIPLLQAIQIGLFDAASILIESAYMPGLYGDTSLGTVIRFGGIITDLQKTGRTSASGSCKPDTYTLNQQMPRQVLQPGCRWIFGEEGCGIDRTLYTFSNSVGVGTSSAFIAPTTPFAQPDGYFTQGVVTFTSGRNSGLAGFVQQHVDGGLRLSRAMLFPVTAGDTFNVVAGCNHTMAACQMKFNNLINFSGTPYIPSTEAAVALG